MISAKSSDEMKERMKKVREARLLKSKTQLKELGKQAPEVVKGEPTQAEDTPAIDLPQNKFMLLLNLIMSIQDDVDFISSLI